MNITFRQMRYFIAVAEVRSISGGAASVGISQSAVTDAIRFIEAELGCEMFARHARGVVPTREGQQFLRHARKIVDAMNDIRGGVGSDVAKINGKLSVGVTMTVSGYFLPDLLARYRHAFPAVALTIVEERSDYIEHLLVNGELDLAILIVPGLIASTGMPMINAVGSSLVAVTAFGLTTSLNYAASGLIDWPLAAVFITGGIVGGVIGAMVAKRLSGRKGLLNTVFAVLIFCVAGYMIWHSARALRA